jgi:hypothetical protein
MRRIRRLFDGEFQFATLARVRRFSYCSVHGGRRMHSGSEITLIDSGIVIRQRIW